MSEQPRSKLDQWAQQFMENESQKREEEKKPPQSILRRIRNWVNPPENVPSKSQEENMTLPEIDFDFLEEQLKKAKTDSLDKSNEVFLKSLRELREKFKNGDITQDQYNDLYAKLVEDDNEIVEYIQSMK